MTTLKTILPVVAHHAEFYLNHFKRIINQPLSSSSPFHTECFVLVMYMHKITMYHFSRGLTLGIVRFSVGQET